MKTRFLLLIPVAVLTLAGCIARTPTWSKASAGQREAGDFIYDWPYFDSPQFTNDSEEDAGTVMRLRKQLGRTQ